MNFLDCPKGNDVIAMFVVDVIEIYNYLRVLVLTMKNVDINNLCEENKSNQNVFCKICFYFFFQKM